MLLLVSTAIALGAIIGFKFDRHVLFIVVATGMTAGLGMMLRLGHVPPGGLGSLAIFALSVIAGFIASEWVVRALSPDLLRRIAPAVARRQTDRFTTHR